MMKFSIKIMGVVALVAAVVFVVAQQPSPPPRPESYHDAVLVVLHERHVEVRSVAVKHGCAPSLERCRTYAGAVTITMRRDVQGHIDCQERWTHCALTVPELAIEQQSLPDVLDPIAWRWSILRAEIAGWFSRMQQHVQLPR